MNKSIDKKWFLIARGAVGAVTLTLAGIFYFVDHNRIKAFFYDWGETIRDVGVPVGVSVALLTIYASHRLSATRDEANDQRVLARDRRSTRLLNAKELLVLIDRMYGEAPTLVQTPIITVSKLFETSPYYAEFARMGTLLASARVIQRLHFSELDDQCLNCAAMCSNFRLALQAKVDEKTANEARQSFYNALIELQEACIKATDDFPNRPQTDSAPLDTPNP